MAPSKHRVVWVTGWPGCGKTTLGDYLARECGFVHIDGDGYQFDPDPAMSQISKPWQKSWGLFFAGEGGTCAAEMWEPYYAHICDEVLKIDAERDVVISLSIHRPARDFVRKRLGPDIAFIGLRMSVEKNAERLLYKFGRYSALTGDTLGFELGADAAKTTAERHRKAKLDTDEDEANCINIEVTEDSLVVPRSRDFLGLTPIKYDDEASVAAAVSAAAEENWKRLEQWQPWKLHGNLDMKVTAKRSIGSYTQAARRFLTGGDEKDGIVQRPYGKVTVSGLGAAISIAAVVATTMQQEGHGEITRVSTDYVQISAASAPRLKIAITRKV